MANSYTGTNSYKSTATPSTIATYKQGQFGEVTPLISDLLTEKAASNSYTKALQQGDSSAIQDRLKEYSVYDADDLGGLADYFRSKSAANKDDRLYLKEADYQAAADSLSGIANTTLTELSPLLGDLTAVGSLGDNTYYDKSSLENQLSNYGTTDLSKYADYSSVKSLAPAATVGGTAYYKKSDLDALSSAKNYWSSVDPTIAKILGSSYGRDDLGEYTVGLVNPSNFVLGDSGYTKQDIGDGKYNIIGADGSVLGTGYKDVATAVSEILYGNAYDKAGQLTDVWKDYVNEIPEETLKQYFGDQFGLIDPLYETADDYATKLEKAGYKLNPNYDQTYAEMSSWVKGGDVDQSKANKYIKKGQGYSVNGKYYDSAEAAQAAYDGSIGQRDDYKAGALADWEMLGQALSGAASYTAADNWGDLPLNDATETISGENTLYGSTPVFYDGKLIGYTADLGTGGDTGSRSRKEYKTSWSPFGYQSVHDGKSHAWAAGLGRKLDTEGYKGLVQGIGDTTYYAPLESVSKLPGWTNVESYNEQDKNYGGLLHEVFKFVDPILDSIDPMHNTVQKWTTGSSETEGQSPYFQKIAPMILDFFLPGAGTIVGGLDSASNGDVKGVLGSIASYGLGSWLDGMDITGMGDVANAAASGAIKGGVGSLISSGGDWETALKGTLMGGLSSGTGSYLSDSGALAKIAAQGGLGALGAALGDGNISKGALAGLLSGGLGALTSAGGKYASDNGYGNSYGKVASIASPIIKQLLAKQLYK